ncbi:MAG: agmatinase [Lachnospiraceae bacterium]
MLNKNIETFIGCEAEYEEAGVVLFGAPFDSTTSFRPGTRFGCRAIRSESFGLETYSPYQDKDLADYAVFDSGDVELCIGDTEMALRQLEERADVIIGDGKIPFMLGGEHLVTLAAVRAVVKKYPDLAIIHFDAHADLRDDYLGARLSHACVLRRCWELVGDGNIHQFGIRSGDREEFIWGRQGHVNTRMFDFEGLNDTLAQLKDRPVYLTIDLDVLDPSVFPGTGTPEAGGVTFMELLGAATEACLQLNIVGCDVNELCPVYDPSGVSTAVAGKIVRELLIGLSSKEDK